VAADEVVVRVTSHCTDGQTSNELKPFVPNGAQALCVPVAYSWLDAVATQKCHCGLPGPTCLEASALANYETAPLKASCEPRSGTRLPAVSCGEQIPDVPNAVQNPAFAQKKLLHGVGGV